MCVKNVFGEENVAGVRWELVERAGNHHDLNVVDLKRVWKVGENFKRWLLFFEGCFIRKLEGKF